ncbi:MAG TPA: recombinase zinc beta ribbon domain-containing protein, partial [Ktedonobacteraceae bacterium]|nr:recombinase zinc beta ribbon domain-containing protein [Ktedonobacteraceae bacterium]
IKKILANVDRYLSNETPVLAYGFLPIMDENSSPYTCASIARLISQLAEKYNNNLQKVAAYLTDKQVPTGREANWHASTIAKMLADEYVIGKAAAFQTITVREEGSRRRVIPRDRSEWVYLPDGVVEPILVTEEGQPDIALFERVQSRLEINQKSAIRNNQDPKKYLLRGGFIKCGYCDSIMHGIDTKKEKEENYKVYRCSNALRKVEGINRCQGSPSVSIRAHVADNAAWSVAVEIIRDPSEVDRKLEAWRTADPNAERRQHITGELTKIKNRRARLTARLEDEDLDDETYADVKLRLKELAEQKKGYEKELRTEINMYDEWLKMQERLNHFHKRCQEMREKLDDPEFEPDYDFKREAIEFFGLVAKVWKTDHRPRIVVESNPPSIMSHTVCCWTWWRW